MLGMADHVHVEDASFVQFLDNVLWWNSNSRNEKGGLGVDDDVDELVEFALGVVIAVSYMSIDIAGSMW